MPSFSPIDCGNSSSEQKISSYYRLPLKINTMTELQPYPFGLLVERIFDELDNADTIFGLPRKKFFLGDPDKDLSISFHRQRASSPLGPASGPQTQMAQNIVLSWLCGCRIIEFKTVQILDELNIPRPCIDMATVGYNIEWSQELKLEQSLHEYVKGMMLIEILKASGRLDLSPGFGDVIYDMSVGYDLKGIKSKPVQSFINGIVDARQTIDHYKKEIPGRFSHFRLIDFPPSISNSLTLSTFHGCPPDEIEQIVDYLLNHNQLNCVIKLNPTLLGEEQVNHLLHQQLGYGDIKVPTTAFEGDATWSQTKAFIERLQTTAEGLGLGFGIKVCNTLVVENHRDFFPASEKVMYLSGAPLHVLAVNLVEKIRHHFKDQIPISFSAGIDHINFSKSVALGLVPVTTCSDLLKTGGYSRTSRYFSRLQKEMKQLEVDDIDEFIIKALGKGKLALKQCCPESDDPRLAACLKALGSGQSLRLAAGEALFSNWVSEAKLLNTHSYAIEATSDPRYNASNNSKPPHKVGSSLELFDCLTCDKCIPVCPNDANFILAIPSIVLPVQHLTREEGNWLVEEHEPIKLKMKHQIGNFTDFCNECGNCDVFCPEDDGPYLIKPRFFSSLENFNRYSRTDGFLILRSEISTLIHGRFNSIDYKAVVSDGKVIYSGPTFSINFQCDDPLQTVKGEAEGSVDLTYYEIMAAIRQAVLDTGKINYISALANQQR